ITARSLSQLSIVLETGMPYTPSVLENGSWTICRHVHRRRYVEVNTQEVQITVNPTNYCPNKLEYIKHKFMRKADKLFKIYVPLHTEDHCYLMIIDFFNWKLVYLDSLKDSKVTKVRKDQMLYVVVNKHTRIRLAIDIVLGRHNPIRAEIASHYLLNFTFNRKTHDSAELSNRILTHLHQFGQA
ncbi:hypothetical protein S245_067708, partial [Arachis hypogaea]